MKPTTSGKKSWLNSLEFQFAATHIFLNMWTSQDRVFKDGIEPSWFRLEILINVLVAPEGKNNKFRLVCYLLVWNCTKHDITAKKLLLFFLQIDMIAAIGKNSETAL